MYLPPLESDIERDSASLKFASKKLSGLIRYERRAVNARDGAIREMEKAKSIKLNQLLRVFSLIFDQILRLLNDKTKPNDITSPINAFDYEMARLLVSRPGECRWGADLPPAPHRGPGAPNIHGRIRN